MALKVTKVDVWAGDIQDQPGGLARVLSAVADAGGSLECVIARRDPSNPGMGEVFVTPLKGAKVQAAARGAGLSPAANLATLRIEGGDSAGLGARFTEALGEAGINVRGVTTAVIGRTFVTYVGLDDGADASEAMAALRKVSTTGRRATRKSGRARPAARGARRGGAKKTTAKKRR